MSETAKGRKPGGAAGLARLTAEAKAEREARKVEAKAAARKAEREALKAAQAMVPADTARADLDMQAVRRVLDDVSMGGAMTTACTRHGVRRSEIVRRVMEDSPPGFAKDYARARELQAEALVDTVIAAANGDSKAEGGVDPQLLRVRVDAAKWVASKILPRIYGDRIDVNSNTSSVTLQVGYVIDTREPQALPPAVQAALEPPPVVIDVDVD